LQSNTVSAHKDPAFPLVSYPIPSSSYTNLILNRQEFLFRKKKETKS
jgi:hypothetical protein